MAIIKINNILRFIIVILILTNSVIYSQSNISEIYDVDNMNLNLEITDQVINEPLLIIRSNIGGVDLSKSNIDSMFFWSSTLNGDLNLNATNITSQLSFHYTKFNKELILFNSTLPKYIEFYYCRFANEVDFTLARTSDYEIHYLNLMGTDVQKLKFRYKRFKLWFPESFQYQNVKFEDKSNVYESLLNNFEKRGYTESYKILDIEYQEFLYLSKIENGSVFVKFWYFIVKLVQRKWWNYGYDKELIVQNTLFFLILFSFINWMFFRHLNENVYKIPYLYSYYESLEEGENFFEKTIYQLRSGYYSLHYTILIFFGLKLERKEIKYNNILGTLYLFLIYFLGLICTAYLLNLILSK